MSPELRLMRHPFLEYRRLRDDGGWGWRRAGAGSLLWLGVVACFVSWTTSGQLLPSHLLLSPFAWWWAPALQMVWIALAARAGAVEAPAAEVIALYHRGHGPWFLLLWAVAAFAALVPAPRATLSWSLPVLVGLFAVAAGWSSLLTYGLFRGAFGCDRRASLWASAVYYGGVTACIVGYFALAGQLGPILGWSR